MPLVALIGPLDVQQALGDYLRSQHAPRVHSIGIADPHSAAGTFGERCGGGSGGGPAAGRCEQLALPAPCCCSLQLLLLLLLAVSVGALVRAWQL